MEQVLIFTTAPAVFDGFGSETAEVVGVTADGKEVRCVRAQARHAEWQRQRYLSGNHFAIDQTEMFRRVHARVITGKTLIDRMAESEAQTLDYATKNALILLFGGSIPAFVTRDSELAIFVDEHGRLNEWGHDVAARVILADPECLPPLKLRARTYLEQQARPS